MNIVSTEEYTSKKDSFHRIFLKEPKRLAGIALVTPALRKKIGPMTPSAAHKILADEMVFKIRFPSAGYWDETIIEFEDIPSTVHCVLLHNVKTGEVFPIDYTVHHYDSWPGLLTKIKGKWVVDGVRPLKRHSKTNLAILTEEVARIRAALGGKPKIQIKRSRKGTNGLSIRISSKL